MGRAFLSGFFGFFGALAGAFLVALAVGLVTLALNGSVFDFTGDPSPPSIRPIGASERVGDVDVTVNGVRESQGDFLLRPGAGNKWIIVDVTARNRGNNPYFFSAYFQAHVRDRDGRNYNAIVAFGPQLRGVFDGSVPAGSDLRGEVAFEVPQNASGLIFTFQQLRGSDQGFWALE